MQSHTLCTRIKKESYTRKSYKKMKVCEEVGAITTFVDRVMMMMITTAI